VNHKIDAFIINEEGDLESNLSVDSVLFTARNAVFVWFFYETFDAHECHDGNSGIGTERDYSNDDLIICRSRLLYYFDEDIDDLIRYIENYIKEKEIVDTVKEISKILDDDAFEREFNYEPINIGLAIGYTLKFIDKLIDLNSNIKIKFN